MMSAMVSLTKISPKQIFVLFWRTASFCRQTFRVQTNAGHVFTPNLLSTMKTRTLIITMEVIAWSQLWSHSSLYRKDLQILKPKQFVNFIQANNFWNQHHLEFAQIKLIKRGPAFFLMKLCAHETVWTNQYRNLLSWPKTSYYAS